MNWLNKLLLLISLKKPFLKILFIPFKFEKLSFF